MISKVLSLLKNIKTTSGLSSIGFIIIGLLSCYLVSCVSGIVKDRRELIVKNIALETSNQTLLSNIKELKERNILLQKNEEEKILIKKKTLTNTDLSKATIKEIKTILENCFNEN